MQKRVGEPVYTFGGANKTISVAKNDSSPRARGGRRGENKECVFVGELKSIRSSSTGEARRGERADEIECSKLFIQCNSVKRMGEPENENENAGVLVMRAMCCVRRAEKAREQNGSDGAYETSRHLETD